MDTDEFPVRNKKQIHYKLPWKTQTKKKQAPIKIKKIQTKKPEWNDNTYNTSTKYFDNQMKQNIIRNEKYEIQRNQLQANDNYQQDFDEDIYKPLGKKNEKSKSNDPRTKTAQVLEEKMEKERKIYESYHTLQQIQELTNKENARKNAQVLRKHEKELEQLRWMIDNDDAQKQENEKIQQERYKKLLEQKQQNLLLQKQIVDQKRHQSHLTFKRNAEIEQSQPHPQVKDENPPAEYVEGLMWENDPRPVQKGVVNIHDAGEDVMKDDKANQRVTLFQKKQKIINEQIENQLQDVQRQQNKRQREVNDLIELHKDQVDREKEYQNRHFQAIEQRVNQLKGIIDPLEEKMRQQKDEDKYSGNIFARTSAKMIQTYNEQITELLIDDLLLEMVEILEEDENQQKKKNQKLKREAVVRDYIEEFKCLAEEQDEIEDRVSRKYKGHDFYNGISGQQRQYIQEPIYANYIGVEIALGQMVNILEKRNIFSDSLFKLSHYSRKNQECFRIITEELIDEILEEETRNIDKANNEFAEAIYQNEFQ